ncbi:MAG: hypothetical protein KA186_12215, partial [Flavobacteriales bacterium]|nr:hypothetical protein [Flavobacteriales bacterium]
PAGFEVSFLQRIDDVTAQVLAELKDDMTEVDRKAKIREIGGNDEIVVSFLTTKDRDLIFGSVVTLYRSGLVTYAERSRIVCLVPVKELLPLIRYAKSTAFEVEHVFDY